jgi:hypothetical protein
LGSQLLLLRRHNHNGPEQGLKDGTPCVLSIGLGFQLLQAAFRAESVEIHATVEELSNGKGIQAIDDMDIDCFVEADSPLRKSRSRYLFANGWDMNRCDGFSWDRSAHGKCIESDSNECEAELAALRGQQFLKSEDTFFCLHFVLFGVSGRQLVMRACLRNRKRPIPFLQDEEAHKA